MKRPGRVRTLLLTGALLCALAAALLLGGSAWVVRSAQGRILTDQDTPPEADCILVLGCGVYSDGTPMPMLTDRLLTGIALYEKGWSDTLFFTGDNAGEDYNEVGAMETFSLDRGVPAEAITLDGQGYSTYESLYRAKEVYGFQRVVIVTQRYHLSRALYLAQSLGLDAWGMSADLRSYPGQSLRVLREIAARDKDILWAKRQPVPASVTTGS
jgi:vancomycin permeability regulator SanA